MSGLTQLIVLQLEIPRISVLKFFLKYPKLPLGYLAGRGEAKPTPPPKLDLIEAPPPRRYRTSGTLLDLRSRTESELGLLSPGGRMSTTFQ